MQMVSQCTWIDHCNALTGRAAGVRHALFNLLAPTCHLAFPGNAWLLVVEVLYYHLQDLWP
jgi:hypothetical protein